MSERPVRLRVSRDPSVAVRYHVGKFAEPEPVVIKVHCVADPVCGSAV